MSITTIGQALTTMNQLQQKMDMIGHNLANSSTPGYKSGQAEFSALLFENMMNLSDPENAAGRQTPEGIRAGTGARLGAINKNMQPGSVQETDRNLDVALLYPQNFFQIQVAGNGRNEVHYTRDGSFYLQPVGNGTEVMLVTKQGHPVLGENGPIRFASSINGVEILPDGSIFTKQGTEQIFAGQLAIARIDRVRLLESAGENLFRLPDLDGPGVQVTQAEGDLVKQGMLEMSNVNLAEEMTGLIGVQRAYQMNARGITMADQMQGLINSIR